ncbi:HAMP domain-containing sensor histidine kinase [Paucibacter sp. R3-3]|uniref:histidine kinase n=1 Tax=Roseateles agri TaxID=3098619 RepID=A0ABU5DI78_9BURK|nr:HAMP domain-containing sensor histidine kinase [Paucibacter sp. R3-3]MDY0745486.1 HAMP domain-containing sensor histidine kinase [Paucibacter sp. R3-3]
MADESMLAAQLDAAVIHDLKNRLAILDSELATLNEQDLPPEARRHALSAREQASTVTHKLVEYLTLRRAAAPGGLRADTQEDTPALLLEELQADALSLAGGRVEVLVDAAGAPGFWFYDRYLVLLALDSALYNALRFARSRITLGASATAGGICFSIRDDGPGVQAMPGASSTGLGLRVCEAVAAAHRNRGLKGHCTLRSERDGGAVFELHLP